MEFKKNKRTAREIKVESKFLNNKNINVKIGTIENREAPETIYIFISFWLKPLKEMSNEFQDYLNSIINQELDNIYKIKIRDFLLNSDIFINEKDSIFIKNVPENINYNNKRNFISLELYLHTVNIKKDKKIPLNKKDTTIFDEAIKIVNIIGDTDFMKSNNKFNIFKKST